MDILTKSKYVDYMACLNRAWLDKNLREEKIEEDLSNNPFVQGGIEAGVIARNLFGNFELVDNDDSEEALARTRILVNNGIEVICEATFQYENNLCKVDILKKNEDDSYSIYEVKATTDPYKGSRLKLNKKYIDDISFQYFVCTKSGLNIKDCYIVYINSNYIYEGEYDLQLFKIDNVTAFILTQYPYIEDDIAKINNIINQVKEPDIYLSSKKCTDCPYRKHCYKVKNIPEVNSVLDLYRDVKKYYYANKGILTFEDLKNNDIELSDFNKKMVDSRLDNLPPYVDKEKMSKFFRDFEYPIYFLDFETYQTAVPKVMGTRPYQQIPFQYSLHILYSDGTLEHKAFLSQDYIDPRRDFINHMIPDLRTEGTIVAYNSSFEVSRITELSRDFPEYSNELLALTNRFVDLMIPFSSSMYYQKEMSRTSIKDVLPALFPNEPELDYSNLTDVHKGDEASAAFLKLPTLSEYDRNKLRYSLLKYCELDTFAMVKIYNYLIDLI